MLELQCIELRMILIVMLIVSIVDFLHATVPLANVSAITGLRRRLFEYVTSLLERPCSITRQDQRPSPAQDMPLP